MIDYTREDFTQRAECYDLIFDVVGKMVTGLPKSKIERELNSGGDYVSIEMDYKESVEDLIFIRDLIEAGHIRSVIDRTYPLEQVPEAHRYVEKGHKKGNVVIRVVHRD